MRKTGVLLVNLGTPNSPNHRDVYRYLIEFLTDPRVIDLPWWKRQLLVRGIIVPSRYRNSAASYRAIWTDKGSPLMVYGEKVRELLQERLGEGFEVALAMRYQNPSIPAVMKELEQKNLQRLVVIPLFPQYASATTGSVYEIVMSSIKKWNNLPCLHMVSSFPTLPEMIETFGENAKKFDLGSYDHYLFSFHGLPQRQIMKGDKTGCCLKKGCCEQYCAKNQNCYSAQCHATANAIRGYLNLCRSKTSVCFQSRLGKEPWLQPYASEHLMELVKKEKKRILVFSPAFVADCLETIYEIENEYRNEFYHAGGEKLDLVPSLNDHPRWIDGLASLVGSRI